MTSPDWTPRPQTFYRLLPTPWAFDGRGIRTLLEGENRWLVSRATGDRLSFQHGASDLRVKLPAACLIKREPAETLLLDCQLTLLSDRILVQPLPPEYWPKPNDKNIKSGRNRPCVDPRRR